MRSFGNSGASSLIRSATAAYNKTQAFNDASAAFEFDMSDKTQEDFDKYSAYLNKRVDQTKTVDPTKALSLTRTSVSANRSFVSKEIGRATTDMKFGNISSRDKYSRLTGLWQAAQANGDDNLAQSIYSQMASLSVQIQNEDTAAASRATAGVATGQAATKKGIDSKLGDFDDHVRIAKDLVEQGQLSVNDYQRIVGEAAVGKEEILRKAANGELGGLSDDQMSAFRDKYTTLTTQDSFKKDFALANNANSGLGSQYLSVDPSLKAPGGNNLSTLKDLPGGVNTTDADGNVIKQYLGGWQGKDDQKVREKAVKNGSLEYIFPQVGTGKAANTTSMVGGKPIADGKGGYYVVDQNGRKHGVTLDPNATLQRFRYEDGATTDFGPTSTTGQAWQGIKDTFTSPDKALGTLKNGMKQAGAVYDKLATGVNNPGGLISSLFARSGKAQEQMRQAAIAKQQQEQMAAAKIASDNYAAQQAKLLPVFRAPQPIAPPKAILPAGNTQAPLPKLVPLGTTGLKVPAKTGNQQQDIVNTVRSLGRFL